MSDNPQIPLSFRPRRNDNFEQFVVGKNQIAFAAAKHFLETPENSLSHAIVASHRFLYLKGDSGSGKSLLLNAVCNQARESGRVAIYLSIRHLINQGSKPPADLEGIEVLCLDDVDSLAGNAAWEEAVFHYLNRMRAQAGYVILAGRQGPGHLAISLPDLRSRLAWGEVHRLKVLADYDKKNVLQQHARVQGVEVPDEVLNYLLKHGRRDMKSLLSALDTLQQKAFAAKRAPTIPLLREVLINPDK